MINLVMMVVCWMVASFGYYLINFYEKYIEGNIFVNNALINDKEALSDTVKEGDEIYFMQALSGG